VFADRVRRVLASERLCLERCLPDQANGLNPERYELDWLALGRRPRCCTAGRPRR